MSRVVVELMEEMHPILSNMASAMAEVKKSNDPTAVLKQFGQDVIMDANELLGGCLQEQYLHKDMNIFAKDMDLKTTDHKITK